MITNITGSIVKPILNPIIVGSAGGNADTSLSHVIIYGQSLSLGSVPTGGTVISSANANHKMFNGGVRAHYDQSGMEASPNKPIDPDQIASLVTLEEQLNPDNSDFAETYASGIALGMSTTCLFSSTGRGAYTAIKLSRTANDVFVDANHFQNTYAVALQGKELADAAGLTYAVGAIVFKQGEADAGAGTSKASWKTEVTTLAQDLVTHLKNATHTDTSGVNMIVDQLAFSRAGMTYDELKVGAIEMHRTTGNNTICAGPTYVEEFVVNDVHMTSNGYRNYGERLGRVIEAEVNGSGWNPCYITSVSRSTTTITVNVYVPAPPLVVDTTLVATIADKGFTYSGANITDVSITDTSGVITITIDADAGGTLSYAYANGTDLMTGPVNGSRGNIRDSESAVTVNDGKNLYNWLCVDQWTVS